MAFGLGLIGGILIIFVVASTPSAYDEIARDYERACLANDGWDDWDWSSGMSLEQFCNDAGALYAHELERKNHQKRF